MNNWQYSFHAPVDLTEHLQKPYYAQFEKREKRITKFVFDERANLVWCGDSFGVVSSYDLNTLPSAALSLSSLYTRCRAHHVVSGTSGQIYDMLSHKNGILSLSDDSLHFANRRGVSLLNLTSIDIAAFMGLQAMCYASKDTQNQVYLAGDNTVTGIAHVDLNRGSLASTIPYQNKVTHMRSNNSKILALGNSMGSVDLLDINSNSVITSVPLASSTISSMDLKDNTLVVVGKTEKYFNSYSDPFVNVFDIRTMRQLPPISFSKGSTMGSGGADFVQLHPKLPTLLVVGSRNGSFDFVDLVNPTLRTQYVNPSNDIQDMVLSPNGDHLGILQGDGFFGAWSRANATKNFTTTTELLEYPDFVDDGQFNTQPVSIDDENYPLSSIGLPYYMDKLLSSWPRTIFNSDGTIPQQSDLLSLKISNNLQRKNLGQQSPTINGKKLSGGNATKFPLQKYDKSKYTPRNLAPKYICLQSIRKKIRNNVDAQDLLKFKVPNKHEIPPAYCKLPLTIRHFTSDGFAYREFNHTEFSGLDNDIDNDYTNAIILLYRFVPDVFNAVVGYLKDENFRTIILTDLGYLFDMLQRSKGGLCRSYNFQTSLNANNEARELGLVQDENMNFRNLTIKTENNAGVNGPSISKSIAQRFNSFLVSTLVNEETKTIGNHDLLLHSLGMKTEVLLRGINCRHQKISKIIKPSLNVMPSTRNHTNGFYKKLNNQNILPYIESSMKRSYYTTNTCESCGNRETFECEESVTNLPPVLSLELQLTVSEWTAAKSVKNWLCKSFHAGIIKGKPQLRLSQLDLKGAFSTYKYELNGYVARVYDPEGEVRLVSYIRYFDQESEKDKWYLFNNYLVTEIDEEEALNISYWWKTPEIVIYSDSEDIRKPFFSVDTYRISYDILYRDHFANVTREGVKSEYRLLTFQEAPKPGSLVAIDAEFVMLNNELCDIDNQGCKTIIRSKKSGLARVSVLRGDDGDLFGVPFIDDYVVNHEHIEDYLTRYSGIQPGDLDLDKSKKALVSREVVYRKIWLLLQLGCVFVGHGLSNDFKHININVPNEQIRDTAIYFLQGKRFLSLRYLAYELLGSNIQEGDHDSVEDAYTALILYRKYLDLKRQGTIEHVLSKIYDEGRAFNYRVPSQNGTGHNVSSISEIGSPKIM